MARAVLVVYVTRGRGKQRDEEKRHKHQYLVYPMDLSGHRVDAHDTAKLGCPWASATGRISLDFVYFYQIVSIPTAAPDAGQPTAFTPRCLDQLIAAFFRQRHRP